jgi:hypothetical protein
MRPSHRDFAGLLSTSTITTAAPLPPGVSVLIGDGSNVDQVYIAGIHGKTSWLLRDDRAARRWARIDVVWHALRLPGTWVCARYDQALGIAP